MPIDALLAPAAAFVAASWLKEACPCGHARREHYGALARRADAGPCKVKGCPCPKYLFAGEAPQGEGRRGLGP